MRPIDADVLINKYGDWYTEEGTEEGFIGTLKSLAEKLPTIELERKKGKWIHYDSDSDKYDDIRCSECKKSFTVDANRWTDIGFITSDLKYCPNCGADMRGEQDE